MRKRYVIPILPILLLTLGACATSGDIGTIGTGSKVIDRTGQKMIFLSKSEISGEACRWGSPGGDEVREQNSVVAEALGNAMTRYAKRHRNEVHPDALVNVSVKTSTRTWIPGVATHVCVDIKGVPVKFSGVPNRLS